VLEGRGKGVAALVSMEDLSLLEASKTGKTRGRPSVALAEMKRKGEKPIRGGRSGRTRL